MENWFTVTAFAATMVVTFLNVVLRYVFKTGLPWAEELVRYLMIAISFLGIDICLREAKHLGMDFVFQFVGPRGNAVLTAIINLIGLAFSLAVAYLGGQLTIKVFRTGQLSAALQVPMWIFYLVMPVGGALAAIRYTLAIWTSLTARHSRAPQGGGSPC